jgi:membrane protease YdiL (CAAX protease family)
MRWWRPVLAVVVLVGTAAVVLALVSLGVAGWTLLTGGSLHGGTPAPGAGATVTPGDLLGDNLVLAALIPLAAFSMWAGFGRRPGGLSSVAGHLRRRWLLLCGVVALAVMVAATLLGGLVGSQPFTWHPEPRWPQLFAVVVVTTPLQAAGEEYLFRGWVLQVVGSTIGRPVIGTLLGGAVSSALFALAHGQQDPWLFADRFGFGALACLLVLRTGGLEAGIALHTVNNLVAFGVTVSAGQLSDALTPTGSDPVSLVVDLLVLSSGTAALLLAARRVRPARTAPPAVRRPQVGRAT